jgi:hypothetical protein
MRYCFVSDPFMFYVVVLFVFQNHCLLIPTLYMQICARVVNISVELLYVF